MAKTNRAGLSPEERTAQRLLQIHDLRVPINVEELASCYADIEEDDIPVPTDGIVLHHPKKRNKPLIVLNRQRPSAETRKRFTLAHELGHLLIGWHPGTIACNIQNGSSDVWEEHLQFETEANRFASELLMPSDWIAHEIGRHENIRNLYLAVIKSARVSPSAARIKLLKCLDPGYVCVEEDNEKREYYLGASWDGQCPLPSRIRGRIEDRGSARVQCLCFEARSGRPWGPGYDWFHILKE